jgi:hypothetical protein
MGVDRSGEVWELMQVEHKNVHHDSRGFWAGADFESKNTGRAAAVGTKGAGTES